jgi:hypothetical protein
MEVSNTDKVVCKCGAIILSKNIMISKAIDSEGDEVIHVSTQCVKCWTRYKQSFYGVLSLEEYEDGTDLAIIRKAKQTLQSEIDKESFINMCNCGARIYEHLIEYSHPSTFEKDITVIKAKCFKCGAIHSTSKRIDIDKMKAIEIKEMQEMLKEALQDKIYGKE